MLNDPMFFKALGDFLERKIAPLKDGARRMSLPAPQQTTELVLPEPQVTVNLTVDTKGIEAMIRDELRAGFAAVAKALGDVNLTAESPTIDMDCVAKSLDRLGDLLKPKTKVKLNRDAKGEIDSAEFAP